MIRTLLAIALSAALSHGFAAEHSLQFNPAETPLPWPMGVVQPFSDRDEDSRSRTASSLVVMESSPEDRGVALVYTIPENTTLGYQYAGISFSFEEPQRFSPDSEISIRYRHEGAAAVRLNARTTDRRNIQGPQLTATGKGSAVAIAQAGMLNPPGNGRLTDFSLSIDQVSSGRLEILEISFVLADTAKDKSDAPTQQGMPYHWRSPGAYFNDPVSISDRDESSTSQSSMRLSVDADSGEKPGEFLHGRYAVRPNNQLGYAYAGFAIPFHAPMKIQENASIEFRARANPPIDKLEVVLRDASHQRSVRVVQVSGEDIWQQFSIPASQFTGIDASSIESVALVVAAPGEGTLDVADLHIPVTSDATKLTILQDIRTRPKWHYHADMAAAVADHMDRHLVLLVGGGGSVAGELTASEHWRPLLESTVNVHMNSIPDSPVFQSIELKNAGLPLLLLLDGDRRELARTADFSGSSAAKFLAAHRRGSKQ